MSTKVSIITVSFNSEKTIARTVESVLVQKYSDLEYIIIDGASTDRTVDIAKGYESEFAGKLRVISEPDDGIYFAMNKGISMATGELVGIINSDDRYSDDAIKLMVERFERIREAGNDNKYIVLYGQLRAVDVNGKEISVGYTSHEKLREEMIPHPTCFVTKDTYEDLGPYDTRYISAADYDFMLRLYESGRVRFEYVDSIIADFTVGGMSAGSAAYYDLLKVRRDHGLITKARYTTEVVKCRMHDFYAGRLIKR